MIRISQLKLKVGHTREELFEEIIHQAAWEKTCLMADCKKVCGCKKEATAFLCVYNCAKFENEKSFNFQPKKVNGHVLL